MILCSGCFDGLHAGHVRYLTQAHALSPTESLYVAIAPDSYIRTEKAREPFWSQAERAETVLALSVVDRVLLPQEPSAAATIREYRPQWFVKGADWRNQLPEDLLEACRAVDCRIAYVDTPGRHVSEARA